MHFLFSSFTGLPDHYFEGYCFFRDHYIYGDKGARAFCEEHGETVGPGEDGCYLAVSNTSDGHWVGTDYCGYKKIFYFSSGGVWAFSNSLAELGAHLKENGVKLTINYPQLRAFAAESTITSQVNSFDTIFNEIKLLPSFCVLKHEGNGLVPVERDTEPDRNYDDAIRQFVATWTRRFETLLRDPRVQVSADLTGGKDSRAVFALLNKAAERASPEGAPVKFRSGTAEHWAEDLRAARAITEHFGMTINADSAPTPRMSAETSYNAWRALNLGIYTPIYFPSKIAHPFNIHMSGGGAENHRPFYPLVDPEDFVDRKVSLGGPGFLRANWKAEFLASTNALIERDSSVHPMILHYREFRNRMHAGREPQYRVVVNPLASKLLEPASRCKDKAETSQLLFDIMETVLPGIIQFDYDDPKKGPTDLNLRKLLRLNVDFGSGTGKVYGEEPSSVRPGESSSRSPIELLAAEYEEAKRGDVLEFYGRNYLRATDKVMAEALASGKFRHASDAKGISRVLTTALAFDVVVPARLRKQLPTS